MKNIQAGFSAMEMMVVVAIIAILAMIAIPSQMGRIVKEQVVAAIPLADIAKEPIAASWKAAKTLPVDNKEAALPAPEKVVSNFVSALEVKDGVINMTFGNKAHPNAYKRYLDQQAHGWHQPAYVDHRVCSLRGLQRRTW